MLTLKIAEHFVKRLNSLHKYKKFVFQTSTVFFVGKIWFLEKHKKFFHKPIKKHFYFKNLLLKFIRIFFFGWKVLFFFRQV